MNLEPKSGGLSYKPINNMFSCELNVHRDSMTYDNSKNSTVNTFNKSQKGYRKIKNTMKKLLK